MALTKFGGATNTIQSLADKPNQDGGLTAAQLKIKFDQHAIDNEAYLNDTLTVELDTLDSANVKKTGYQTIQGVKTFESSPIVPTPTTDMQASTKKYVDDKDSAQTSALNTHKTSSDHDGRYYTEAESDAKFETIDDLSNTRKLSSSGNFTGSWFGITSPTYADPGIAGVVAEHTSQLAEKATEVNLKKSISNVIDKINNIANANSGKIAILRDGLSYNVFVPLGKNYMKYILQRDIVTSVASVGGNAELTRVVGCKPNNEVYALIPFNAATLTGTWGGGSVVGEVPNEFTLTKSKFNVGYRFGSVAGTKATFTNVKGTKLNICLASSSQAGTFKIIINGVDKGTFQAPVLVGTTKTIEIVDIPIFLDKTDNTVELEVVSGYLNLIGINAYKLQDIKDESLITSQHVIKYSDPTSELSFYNGSGANDYALSLSLDGSNNLWCGSYHGGETLKSINIYKNGRLVTLGDGFTMIGDSFQIEQYTGITHPDFTGELISTHSIMELNKTGWTFNFSFKFLQQCRISRAEVMMATNHDQIFTGFVMPTGLLKTTTTDYTSEQNDSFGVVHFNQNNDYPYVACQYLENYEQAINSWANNPTAKLRVQRVNGSYQKTYGTRVYQGTIVPIDQTWYVNAKHMIVESNIIRSYLI